MSEVQTPLESAALNVAAAAKELRDFISSSVTVEVEILLDLGKCGELQKTIQNKRRELSQKLGVAERELLTLAGSVD